MNPQTVNALLTKDTPLTDAEKQSLMDLDFMDYLLGHGVELTPIGEPNRAFVANLSARHGVHSYRLSL